MSICKRLAAWLDGALEEVVAHSLELGSGKSLYQVLRHTVNCCDIRQVDFCAGSVGKLDLGFLGCLLKTLKRHRVLLEVQSAVLCGELPCKPLYDSVVEIITSEVSITVGRLNLEHTVAELKDGDIKGTATEVIYGHLHTLVLLVKTIGKRCSRRLVDDTLNIKTGNLTGFLGSLTLRV